MTGLASLVRVSRPRFLLLLAAVFAALFVVVLGVAYSPPGRAVDRAALQGFIELPRPFGEGITERIAHFADPAPFFVVGAGLAAAALALRRAREAVAVAVLLVGANFGSQLLQSLLAHSRPADFLTYHQVGPEAFPSGHATAAMSVSLAAVLVAPLALRPLAAACGGVFTLGVSFALLVNGWHFPSDVVAGYLLAAFWCLVVLAAVQAADEVRPEPRAVRREFWRGAWVAVGAGVLFSALVLAALALPHVSRIVSYADNYTTFTVVAVGTSVLVAALLGGVAAITTRPQLEPQPTPMGSGLRSRVGSGSTPA
jgi:membrane-associated phospholipid phosphatase